MARVDLKYDSRELRSDIDGATLLGTREVALPDPLAEVRRALVEPVSSPPLAEIVTAGESVAIVTSDITRYSGSEIYLPVIVEQLNAAGVADEQISIIFGLGIHRQQTRAEQEQIVGPLAGRIALYDHDCDDPDQLVDLGPTSSGLPVRINRRVAESDRVIVTGTVGLHYFAGFGGGRKGLVPGVSGRDTCLATHFSIFNPPQTGGRNPLARTANLDGNPVHQAILEAALKIQPDFLFNTVLTPEKKIFRAFAGDLQEAHLQACAAARKLYCVPLRQPADLAVVSCGGYPKDINFIQSHKALDYGVNALRENGTIILLAACADGFGNSEFYDWFRYRELDTFEAALRDAYQINGQTAYATLDKAKRYRVILVSGFSEEQTSRMGMEKAETLDAALAMAYEKLPPQPETVIIPDGGTILPVIKTG